MLDDEAPDVRASALRSLCFLNSKSLAEHVPAVVQMLKDHAEDVRTEVVEVLEMLDPDDLRHHACAIQNFFNEDTRVANEALLSMFRGSEKMMHFCQGSFGTGQDGERHQGVSSSFCCVTQHPRVLKRKEFSSRSVDHIDGDRSNNRKENLRWASPREDRNNETTLSNRTFGGPKRSKPVKARPVGDAEWSLRFESTCDAATKLGLSRGNIGKCCNKKKGRKSTGGYEFEFDEPNEPAQLPGEEWRRHDETGVLVSSLGRVKYTSSGVVSRGCLRDDGYMVVGAGKGSHGRKRNCLMHRMVAEAFGLPRLPGQTQVNHIDGDRSNNHVENIVWASNRENTQHSFCNNLARGTNAAQHSQAVAVEALGADGAVVARYPSLTAAAEALGIRNVTSISGCITGRRKGCREEGEVWKDIPEDIVSVLAELR